MKKILVIPPESQVAFLIDEKLLFQHMVPSKILMEYDDYLKIIKTRFFDYSNYSEYIIARYMHQSKYLLFYRYLELNNCECEYKSLKLADKIVKPSDFFFECSKHIWKDYYIYLQNKKDYFNYNYLTHKNIESKILFEKNMDKTMHALNHFIEGKIPEKYNVFMIYKHLLKKSLFPENYFQEFGYSKNIIFYYTYEYKVILELIYTDDFLRQHIFIPPENWNTEICSVNFIIQRLASKLNLEKRLPDVFISDVDRILTFKTYLLMEKLKINQKDIDDLIDTLFRIIQSLSTVSIFNTVSLFFNLFKSLLLSLEMLRLRKSKLDKDYLRIRKVFYDFINKSKVGGANIKKKIIGYLLLLFLLRTKFFPKELEYDRYLSEMLKKDVQLDSKYLIETKKMWWHWQ